MYSDERMGRRWTFSFGGSERRRSFSLGRDFSDDEEEDEEDWDEEYLRIIDTYCKVCEEVTIHKIKKARKDVFNA